MGDPEQYQQLVDLVRQDRHFVYGYEEVLILFRPNNIRAEGGREYSPTCSVSLNTYNLHPRMGFLASGGSLYLRTVLVPSTALTVLVSAAKRPDGAKLGFDLSATGSIEPERERVSWGFEERERGEAERRCPRDDACSLSFALLLS